MIIDIGTGDIIKGDISRSEINNTYQSALSANKQRSKSKTVSSKQKNSKE
jgi:hypothetical protein